MTFDSHYDVMNEVQKVINTMLIIQTKKPKSISFDSIHYTHVGMVDYFGIRCSIRCWRSGIIKRAADGHCVHGRVDFLHFRAVRGRVAREVQRLNLEQFDKYLKEPKNDEVKLSF